MGTLALRPTATGESSTQSKMADSVGRSLDCSGDDDDGECVVPRCACGHGEELDSDTGRSGRNREVCVCVCTRKVFLLLLRLFLLHLSAFRVVKGSFFFFIYLCCAAALKLGWNDVVWDCVRGAFRNVCFYACQINK